MIIKNLIHTYTNSRKSLHRKSLDIDEITWKNIPQKEREKRIQTEIKIRKLVKKKWEKDEGMWNVNCRRCFITTWLAKDFSGILSQRNSIKDMIKIKHWWDIPDSNRFVTAIFVKQIGRKNKVLKIKGFYKQKMCKH